MRHTHIGCTDMPNYSTNNGGQYMTYIQASREDGSDQMNNPMDSCLSRLIAPARDVRTAAHTELCTILQEVYRINQDGGHGSRRKVAQMLLELGMNPNSHIESLFHPAKVRIIPRE